MRLFHGDRTYAGTFQSKAGAQTPGYDRSKQPQSNRRRLWRRHQHSHIDYPRQHHRTAHDEQRRSGTLPDRYNTEPVQDKQMSPNCSDLRRRACLFYSYEKSGWNPLPCGIHPDFFSPFIMEKSIQGISLYALTPHYAPVAASLVCGNPKKFPSVIAAPMPEI